MLAIGLSGASVSGLQLFNEITAAIIGMLTATYVALGVARRWRERKNKHEK